MLSNAYLLAKFRFDTAENEPAKNLQNFAKNFENVEAPKKFSVFKNCVEIFENDQKSQNKHSENWIPEKLENPVRGGEV